MAQCLALPANHRAAGPRVLHTSRCPNVNPHRAVLGAGQMLNVPS